MHYAIIIFRFPPKKSCWSRVTINTTRHGQNFAKYLRYLLRLTTTRYRLAVGALWRMLRRSVEETRMGRNPQVL